MKLPVRIPIKSAGIITALAGIAILVVLSHAEIQYVVREWLAMGAYGRQDALILSSSRRYNVPPELVKAVIWRESRFDPSKTGQHGERGLMQVTEGAAADWVKAESIETFVPVDLFSPKTNIDAGTWYLARGLKHWSGREDAVPFALAEFNAGRTHVHRWAGEPGTPKEAADMLEAMDFPTTRAYVASILKRADFYRRRGDFPASQE